MARGSEGLPEWLEDFPEDLEIVEVPAAANISHDSGSECPTKVMEIAKYAFEPRLRGLLAEDALAKQCFEQKSSVT